MREYIDILRKHDLRIIVLAVVLGHAIASGIGSIVYSIGSTIRLLTFARNTPNMFATAVRGELLTGVLNTVLWAIVAIATLALIKRLLEPAEA